jgi:hypothetical protein
LKRKTRMFPALLDPSALSAVTAELSSGRQGTPEFDPL